MSYVALPLLLQITGAKAGWDMVLALTATAIAVTLGLAASVYPALKAARLDPAESLRAI